VKVSDARFFRILVADVDPKHVRFALFGAPPEATEPPPAREYVGQDVVLGKVERVSGRQHVNQRAEADTARVLGQDRVQEQDVGHDLEPVLVEMMLRCPHRVIPEGVAVLGVREEVGVDPPIVGLTVVPLMRGRSLDTSVQHIDGPVEKCAEMHRASRVRVLECDGE
jgi:hypothetical protein